MPEQEEQSKNLEFKDILNKDPFIIPFSIQGTGAATTANYGVICVMPFKCELIQVQESHEVLGTDGGAVTLQIERLQGTEAPAAGDDLLVTAINLKGTINTVVTPALTATKTNRIFNKGDRVALKDSGTLTAVAGISGSLVFVPIGQGHHRII